jgi:hypothetical protein
MCHLDGDGEGAKVITWKSFLANGICEELIRFHPTIPFKYSSKMADQIGISVRDNFRRNNYDLYNRNCEHFANMIVYGINYSEQVYKRISSGNNGKGSTIKLTEEMEESERRLGWTYNELSSKINRQYLQEVPPKENCRIM